MIILLIVLYLVLFSIIIKTAIRLPIIEIPIFWFINSVKRCLIVFKSRRRCIYIAATLDRQMHRQIAISMTERCWAGVLISANDRQNTRLDRHVILRCWNDNRVDEGSLRLGKQRRRRQRRSRSILSFYHPHYDVRI